MKCLLLFPTLNLIGQFNASSTYSQKQIDLAAGTAGFFLILSFGPISHILCVIRTRGILRVFESIALYNNKHFVDMEKGVLARKVIVNNSVGILMLFVPCTIVWNVVTTGKKNLVLFCTWDGDIFTENQIIVSIFLVVAGAMTEFAVLYLYGELFVLSSIMSLRLIMLRESAEEISGMSVPNNPNIRERARPVIVLDSKPKSLEKKQRWNQFGKQYLDFHDMFEVYEKEVTPYYIILFLCLILGSVSMIFYKLNSKSPFSREVPVVLVSAIAFSFYRIFALADCGENIWTNYQDLLGTLLKVNQFDNFLPADRKQVIL